MVIHSLGIKIVTECDHSLVGVHGLNASAVGLSSCIESFKRLRYVSMATIDRYYRGSDSVAETRKDSIKMRLNFRSMDKPWIGKAQF